MLFSKLRGRKKPPVEKAVIPVESTELPPEVPQARSATRASPRPKRPARTMAAPAKKRIGEILLDQGIIDENQLQAGLTLHKATGKKLAACLMDLGFIDGEAFERVLSKQPGLASIDLAHYKIPHELLELVPREFAVQYQLVPLDKMGRMMTVGMVCPLDSATIKKLEEMTGLRVSPMLCSISEVDACIREHYPPKD